jgi:Protein of unknown function (DUF551)
MFEWIKIQLDYRAKYKHLLNQQNEALRNAILVNGKYENLCATLPDDHQESTAFYWKRHADARLQNENDDLKRRLKAQENRLNDMVRMWETNFRNYGHDMYKGWQTMELAPTDGTEVLIFYEYASRINGPIDEFHIQIGHCRDGRWYVNAFAPPAIQTPTHWRPLPLPPTALIHNG